MKNKLLLLFIGLFCLIPIVNAEAVQGSFENPEPFELNTGVENSTDTMPVEVEGTSKEYLYWYELNVSKETNFELIVFDFPLKKIDASYQSFSVGVADENGDAVAGREYELVSDQWDPAYILSGVINVYLKPGKYYVGVQLILDAEDTNKYEYSLFGVTHDVVNTELEPNNESSTSNLLTPNVMYDAYIGGYDGTDNYSVELIQGRKTRIYFNNFYERLKDDILLMYSVAVYYNKSIRETDIVDRIKFDPARSQYYFEFVPTQSGIYHIEFGSMSPDYFSYRVGVYISGTTNKEPINEINRITQEYIDSYDAPIFRMYNPVNGEHLYTASAHEAKIIYEQQGWGFEGVGWYTSKPTDSNYSIFKPIYRLFNPVLGNHLYTSDTYEISVITKTQGWVLDYDGNPVMYSEPTDDLSVNVYRLYNHNLNGLHHLTTDLNEYNVLPNQGWAQEGISMYVSKMGKPSPTDYYYVNF